MGGGGALYLPVIAPDNQQIFMATDMGSLFHSRDFGASWDTLDFRSFQGSPRTQVRFTADPNVLWSINAIREDAKLSRSLDGGRHWQASPRDSLDGSPYYLEVDPERVDRLLVSTRTALFVSRDGGATFQSVTIAPRDAGLILAGAFFDGDQIRVKSGDSLPSRPATRTCGPAYRVHNTALSVESIAWTSLQVRARLWSGRWAEDCQGNST